MTRRLRERLRGEEGFTLLELLVGSSLMLVVLSATLLAFTNLEVRNREAVERAEAQDAVRRESDRLARALRNLAGPTDVDEVAVVAQAAGLDRGAAAGLAVHGALLGPASAAPKLGGFDMGQVVGVVARLSRLADRVAATALRESSCPLPSAPLLELRAERHARWEVRLFAS